MSLKQNITANFISQIYSALVAIIMVPTYLNYMGSEAYGLVGFFAMVQAWFQLLDVGLTPTMAREAARFQAGSIDRLTLQQLFRSLEVFFLSIAIIGAVAIGLSAEYVSNSWLKVENLNVSEVKNAIVLIGIIVGLRWMGGLYRGIITGFERMVWLSFVNIIGATGRFILVVPYFILVGSSLKDFFQYQLVVAFLEAGLLIIGAHRMMPGGNANESIDWSFKPIKKILGFALSIAFTGSLWILVTQTDKLVLSKLLSLKEYGFFTLAILMANGITTITSPVTSALLPKLTKVWSEGNNEEFIRLYRKSTQLVAVLTIPFMLMMVFYSEQILFAWTHDITVSKSAAPILSLYGLGYGILTFSGFTYLLQYAKGDLRMHIVGSILFVVILIPLLIWATENFEMKGAGFAWVISNALYFLFWVPVVHSRLLKGYHYKWLINDIAPVFAVALVGVNIMHTVIELPDDRLGIITYIMCIGFVVLAMSVVALKDIRKKLIFRIKKESWYNG